MPAEEAATSDKHDKPKKQNGWRALLRARRRREKREKRQEMMINHKPSLFRWPTRALPAVAGCRTEPHKPCCVSCDQNVGSHLVLCRVLFWWGGAVTASGGVRRASRPRGAATAYQWLARRRRDLAAVACDGPRAATHARGRRRVEGAHAPARHRRDACRSWISAPGCWRRDPHSKRSRSSTRKRSAT